MSYSSILSPGNNSGGNDLLPASDEGSELHSVSHTPQDITNLTLQPTDYANTISSYAERSKLDFLHCGLNYIALAGFLDEQRYSVGLNQGRETSAPSHIFAVVRNLKVDGEEKLVFDSEAGLDTFEAFCNLPPASSQTGRLIFLRGYISPRWTRLLGSHFRLDPEFFRRNLDFLQNKRYYDLPGLPSTSKNNVRLRVTTICTRKTPLRPGEIIEERKRSASILENYQNTILGRGRAGDSIIRKYSVHNGTICAIEQDISFCVKKRGKHWTAIICLDSGRNLRDIPRDEWKNNQSLLPDILGFCLPVIHHRHKVALELTPTSSIAQSQVQPQRLRPRCEDVEETAQSFALLPDQYGSFLKHERRGEIMLADALYALCELFIFAACAENQFLNMIQTQINEAIKCPDGEEMLASENLKYIKNILDERIENTRSALGCLRVRGDPTWPRAKDKALRQIIDDTISDLNLDYEHLVQQTEILSTRSLENMGHLRDRVQLKESQTALRKADGLHRLSLLAFFFLPLSMTTSLFGMNFKEFGTGNLSIWVCFIVLAPVLGISAIMCFWESIPPWRHQEE